MELASWLRGLGLEQYEKAFRDNEIDAEVLPRLTADDLKDIGVAVVGHRRKLLAAIAELGADGPPATPATENDLDPPRRASTAGQAERRQLTVMFVDLVGSTELSHALDPEEMRELLRLYQNLVTGEVARFDGHVAKLMGDGVLCYFGWPRAHEDEAERAIRTALAIAAAVGQVTAPDSRLLSVRIGVATGLVVVGDLIGEGAAREEAVIGETPNLAARLQSLAGAGEVVVGETTRRLAAGAFNFEDGGRHSLKGIPGMTSAWRVQGARQVESRFAAAHAEHLSSVVGREEELALLLSRWNRAKLGEGQVALLSGEPGIGKSRLIEALRERLADEPHTLIRYQCSPYHTNSALHPTINQLEYAARIKPDDSSEDKLAKLEAVLAPGTRDIKATMRLLAMLLSIDGGERYPPLTLPPAQLREETLNALLEQLLGLAAVRPILFLLEDAHWIDPTTQDQISLAIDRIQDAQVLAVVTFRPEYAAPWMHHRHICSLALSRLGRRESEAIIEQLARGKLLPATVFEQIIEKTDGVPLFVEELTKAILESGLLREGDHEYELAGTVSPLAIPSTLQDSLMARLDRLAPVKEVAQIGAAIGREFGYDLLRQVTDLSPAQLDDALSQLVQSGLVLRRGSASQPTFAFKHALVQDTAYATLLKSRRQQLHARIAQAIQQRLPQRIETDPELLAHHFQQAGLTAEAAEYWERAGRRAIQRAANLEAIEHLQHALAALRALPATAERDGREIDLLIALGIPLIAARGYAAPAVIETYEAARVLCERLGDRTRLFPVLWGLWTTNRARLDMRTARRIAHELDDLAQQLGDESRLLAAHHAEWTTLTYLGELEEARRYAGLGRNIYRADQHFAHTFIYGGHDPGVCGQATEALVLWMQGYPDQALRQAAEALDAARELKHPPSIVHGLEYLNLVRQFRRERELIQDTLEEESRLARQFRLPGYVASTALIRSWAAEDTRAVLAAARQAYASRLMLVSGVALPYFQALLVEVLMRVGDLDDARELLDQALADVERTGMRQWESELRRLKAELILKLAPDRVDEAVGHLHQAIAIAMAQKALALQLRPALALARLLLQLHHSIDKARGLVDPIVASFTEGFDTPDLTEAKMFLAALEGEADATRAARL